jgi:predicted ATPase
MALGHGQTLCNILAQAACPVALLTGDLAAAHRFTTQLLEQSTRYSLNVWHAYGRCFEGISLIRQGDVNRGLALMNGAAGDLAQAGFQQYYTPYLSALAEALGRAGAIEQGLVAIDKALAQVEATGERWCIAELLRIKGELLLQQRTGEAVRLAETQFRQSLDLAESQHALSWQLRSATSLARLLYEEGRRQEAHSLLAGVYERFSEGFRTQDLVAARQLLDHLV